MKHLAILSFCIFLLSCTSGTNNTTEKDTMDLVTADSAGTIVMPATDDTVCYVFTSGKDVYTYKLLMKGNKITGTARYDNFEKDDSKGIVHGSIENNIMHLWYEFESEGMKSVSERYFKITENDLTEGIGMIDVKGDTAYFPSPNEIDYTKGLVFKKTDCL